MKICPVCGIANPDEFNYCQACPTQLGPAENIVAETKSSARKYALILGVAALGITALGLWTSLGPRSEPRAESKASPLLSHQLNTDTPSPPAPAVTATPKPPKVATKEEIADLWRLTVATQNPHLNYVDVKIQKSGKGFAIYATHDYFTQYTMSAGPDAQLCHEFVQLTREELAAAKVVRVGFWGKGPYSRGCWLDVP